MIHPVILWSIIGVSVAVILFFFLRHWRDISSLDVHGLSQERYSQVKNRIIEERIRRKTASVWQWVSHPLQVVQNAFSAMHQKMKHLESKKQAKVSGDAQEKARVLLAQGDDLLRKEAFIDAEKKYIDVLSIDPKNKKAYKGLAQLYTVKKEFASALEVYSHVVLLDSKDDETYYAMSELHQETGKLPQAKAMMERALDLEPNNPKYLHRLIELSILTKDTKRAKEVVEVLAEVNPNNQKLAEFKALIKQLEV